MLNKLNSMQRLIFVIEVGVPGLLFLLATVQLILGGGAWGYFPAGVISGVIWLILGAAWVGKGDR